MLENVELVVLMSTWKGKGSLPGSYMEISKSRRQRVLSCKVVSWQRVSRFGRELFFANHYSLLLRPPSSASAFNDFY